MDKEYLDLLIKRCFIRVPRWEASHKLIVTGLDAPRKTGDAWAIIGHANSKVWKNFNWFNFTTKEAADYCFERCTKELKAMRE